MNKMSEIMMFCRQVRSRSNEHQRAMKLLADAGLKGQMVSILRQELDSMVRVIYLLAQSPERRAALIKSSVNGVRWIKENSKGAVTDKEMVELSQHLQGWIQSVYKFGCAFIHLSFLHDYNDRDPLTLISSSERYDILRHCRIYHGGPHSNNPSYLDLVSYFPRILEKIAGNLEHYLEDLEREKSHSANEI